MATQVQLKSTMKCPICIELLDTPKLLSCSHTFCEKCLSQLHTAQKEGVLLSCPLCRKKTGVAGGDVSKLGTNYIVQSLIEELAARVHYCTVCKMRTPAAIFCADCDKYMCDSCKQKHDGWEMFAEHEEFSMEEVNAGKTGARKKDKCDRHGSEIKDFWCHDCSKYICLRCRMVDHLKHDVIEADDHEKSHKEKIAALLDRVDTKKYQLGEHSAFIKEQQTKAKKTTQKPIQKIEAARDEAIRRIKESSALLISECKEHEQLITNELEGIVGETDIQSACIESAGELVKNGTRGRLEGDALVAHDTLCQELEKLLEDCKEDFLKIGNLSSCAAGLDFKAKEDAGKLGNLEHERGWEVVA